MALSSGSKLGPYEILGLIGEGGMGQVYRARDGRLGRDVAIKVLPDRLVGDAERAARFAREAQSLAALNHPNIAQIYGVEEQALVMELVSGDDLSQTLRKGRLAPEDALAIARQIALALEAAHAAALIHRDLKPANVKVTADGTVKLLDFGLAKAVAGDGSGPPATPSDASNSPTVAAPATAAGMILGTAAYMAPEQARGRAVDKRADIWAFGAVLYEMLSGRPAFGGDTLTDVLAAVVTRDPDWSALPAATPPAIRTLLRRCLQKDPRNRLHDIADARIEIEALSRDSDGEIDISQPPPRPARAPRATIALALLAALALGALIGDRWRAAHPAPSIEWTATRLGGPAVALNPELSPDGHLLAFTALVNGLMQVAVMRPGTGNYNVIAHDRSHGLALATAWATDGSAVYFDRRNGELADVYSVPALGGDERRVIENASTPRPLADGSILFGRINAGRAWQLHRFWPTSGRIEALPFFRSARLTFKTLMNPLDAERIAIFGRPQAGAEMADGIYVFHLTSHEAHAIAPNLLADDVTSLSVDPTDGSVVVAARQAGSFRVLRLDPNARRPAVSLLSLLSQTRSIAVGANGSLFVSLEERPFEVLRLGDPKLPVETLGTGPMLFDVVAPLPAPLPDGRVAVTSLFSERFRVMVMAPGKEPANLAQSDEETWAPLTAVGDDRVAMMMGSRSKPDVAIVSLETGSTLARLPIPRGVSSLGASPDGTTLYFEASGTIYALPIAGGDPRPVGAGDSLVVDPNSGDLIVKLDQVDGSRLMRLPEGGGAPSPIALVGGKYRLIGNPLSPGAIRQGRLVLPISASDSWDWHLGVLDLASGRLERVPVPYATDFHFATWSGDGRILAVGLATRMEMWKFEKPQPD